MDRRLGGRQRLLRGDRGELQPVGLDVVRGQAIEPGLGHRPGDLLRGLDAERIAPHQRALGRLQLGGRDRLRDEAPQLSQELGQR